MSKIGIVFDIQRCSLYDGPGIRTTVFLKGCPLRCKWCHNPESQAYLPEIMYFEEKCTLCKACTMVCKTGSHKITDDNHMLDRETCIKCGKCVECCPYGVLEWKGKETDVQSIINEVEKDRDYYNTSGGGLTLTGGEPMVQFEFTQALLSEAKNRGIHTCLETCGHAHLENYKKILPYTDMFLFDYKATDPVIHRELTGVSNELILSNLDFIYKNGGRIILRCPMIPGVNDSDEHLKGLAELDRRYPDLEGIELMAYHNMGVAKSKRIGKETFYTELKNTEESKKAEWLDKLKQYGCDKAIIG